MASSLARFLLLAAPAATVAASFEGWTYDPERPSEPFDLVAQSVTRWIQEPQAIKRREDGWRGNFCSCMENGFLAGWYQYASAMYLIDTCNPREGLVLRTGHLQDRHIEPLQGMIACDTLKLITYCFSHHAEEALPKWNSTCANAHYTVPACDVNCNAAVLRTGGRGGLVAAMLAGVVVVVGALGQM